MNMIIFRMLIASFFKTIKNPDKKASLRDISREIVQTILLAYSDDPEFLDFLHE